MSRLRFGPAIGALALAVGLGSACATAGEGEEASVDLSEAGTDDVGTSDGAHHDSASNHDSASSSDSATSPDAAAGSDTSTPFDSGTFDAAQPIDASQPVDASPPVDSGPVTCAQSCAGCCVGNTCQTISDSFCPTSGAGGACEDCNSEGAVCFPFLPPIYVCF